MVWTYSRNSFKNNLAVIFFGPRPDNHFRNAIQLFLSWFRISSLTSYDNQHRRHTGHIRFKLIMIRMKPKILSERHLPFSNDIRDYQKDCIIRCLERYNQGITRQVVSLPVGSGKTIIFSELIRHFFIPGSNAKKILILAHREELLLQARFQIKKRNPTLKIGIEKGDLVTSVDDEDDVIIASVQSLGRSPLEAPSTSDVTGIDNGVFSPVHRLLKFDPSQFKMIIIDEAHHSVADSYMRIVNHFKIFDPSSKILLWGCSATLARFDQIALGNLFQEITYHVTVTDMIRKGWLVPPHFVNVRTSLVVNDELSDHDDDFVLNSLSLALNTPTRNTLVFEAWKNLSKKRQIKMTIVFALNVEHVYGLRNTFTKNGVSAVSITGETPSSQRLQILDDCRAGRVPVLINCGVLTEGADIPNVDCVLLARPTKSPSLFIQMVGRGLRLHKDKSCCLVINIVDSFLRPNSLFSYPTLEGFKMNEKLPDWSSGSELLSKTEKKDLIDIKREDLIVLLESSHLQDESSRSHCSSFTDLSFHHLDWVKISSRIFRVGNLVLVIKTAEDNPICSLYFWEPGNNPIVIAKEGSIHVILDKAFQFCAKNNLLLQTSRASRWKRRRISDDQILNIKKIFDSLKEPMKIKLSIHKWTEGMANRVISKYQFYRDILNRSITAKDLLDGTLK